MGDIYWLLRVALGSVEHADRSGPFFAFLPEFYVSVSVNAYNALKSYFTGVETLSKMADWRPFKLLKTPVLNTSSTISQKYIYRSYQNLVQIRNDGLHMYLILFQDSIQDDRLVAILLLKRVPNHFLIKHGPTSPSLGVDSPGTGGGP